jgi:hypothetical protein
MFKFIRLLEINIILSTLCFGSFEKTGIGAASVGLSLSGAASSFNTFSIFSNPAGMLPANKLDLFYRNHFGIKGFDQMALAVVTPFFQTPVGFGLLRNGNNIYSETEIITGLTHWFSEKVSAAFSFSFYHLEIKNYGNAATFGLSISFLYKINDQINIAAVATNINEPAIGEAKQSIPASGLIAISYKPLRDVEILIDTYKEDFYDFEYRIGSRIKAVEFLNFLCGFQQNLNSFSAGLEFINSGYGLFYAIDIHPVLNVSQALGFSYEF